ncbi:MAG TPA: enoyl-CoA hydratase-related protein [Blastocatellia bacterium]|nr:enoyl-CoA hydratase-related protein [Blastocatellia bacterium]
MAEYKEILYVTKNSVANITLNRPDKRNALNDQLISDLREAIAAADADEQIRVIMLRGAGKDFCAGADLSQLEKSAQASIIENIEGATEMANLFVTMRKLKKPIIAAVQGRALAGGAGLASACDMVIATRSAQFCYTETKIGFVPAIVMSIVRRNLGEKRAFEILATAKMFSADEAAAMGFINRIADDADFETEVEKFATEVASLSPSALMLTKYLLYQIDSMSFEQAVRAGVDVNVIARLTPDCQAAVRKFLSKT